MSVLTSEERRLLEKTILHARDLAEDGADKALGMLAVDEREPRSSMSPEERKLRVQLRAVRRRLSTHEALKQACGYEQWHRMLFARFLAENNLLIHPEYRVPVTLDECADIGREQGESDRWVVAAGFAAGMLPGIFPQDDPLLQVRYATEDRIRLEQLLENLPASIFSSDDGLGWTYQFWQTKRKREVQASGLPVEGPDIGAVTQLFTEHYMVQFLLQNTLGAWWLSLHPDSPMKAQWEYYKPEVQHDFSTWPRTVAEVRIIDPCCGSGHFLVEAFNMLLAMYAEEGLSSPRAGESILRNNLFGLEIDDRCVQIAAFALALSVWKAGFPTDVDLPVPSVACSGLPLGGSKEEWRTLANGDSDLASALEELYDMFSHAQELGSLVDPLKAGPQGLFAVDTDRLHGLLEYALAKDRNSADPVAGVFGDFATGALRAFAIMRKQCHLAVTNPPFLLREKHTAPLQEFTARYYPDSRKDLATCFIERCRAFTDSGGYYALVTPQNWLFMGRDKALRTKLLAQQSWLSVARLGPRAFEAIGGEVVQATLVCLGNFVPKAEHVLMAVDVSTAATPQEKAALLRRCDHVLLGQKSQLDNPDSRIILVEMQSGPPLGVLADSWQGICTGDYPRFGRCFWELPYLLAGWEFQLSTVVHTIDYGGREHILRWDDGGGEFREFLLQRLGEGGLSQWIRGTEAWDRKGVAVSQMGNLYCTLYTGEIYDNNVATIVPSNPIHLPALWAFCKSGEFSKAVRAIDQSLKVTNLSFVKVPFDLSRWQAEADKAGPLPEPYSEDPTQWLFEGNVKDSEQPLHVAVARLLGYNWPDQPEKDELSVFADPDGIVCLPAVMGERPAADRLRDLLSAAYGVEWNVGMEDSLLDQVGCKGKGLDAWLRDGFFDGHAKLFHNRPFIWQISDGRKDGFSAVVNYHKLDRQKLEKLTYAYLNDWIRRQKDDIAANKPGADSRLAAAQDLLKKLEAILVGENPYDIYVRWKSKAEQPIGWEPDLNDGVRLNIRPFVTAGVLRSKVTINWNKDRGHDPDGSERINDIHLTLAEKRRAREEETK